MMPRPRAQGRGALIARINWHLRKRGRRLRKLARGIDSPYFADLGAYYIDDSRTGRILARHVDVQALARELGVG